MAVAVFSDIEKVPESLISDFLKYLSPERVERAKKFRREEDYKSCICAALLLRTVLCENFNCENSSLEFDKTPLGKPFLKNSDITFSISHSKNFVSCIAGKTFCGADVEFRRNIDVKLLLRRFHRDERDFILKTEDKKEQERLFFRLWTMKEAYLKATGEGLSGGLDSFCISGFEGERPMFHGKHCPFLLCFECDNYTLSFVSDEEVAPVFISGDELLSRAEGLIKTRCMTAHRI